MVPSPLILTILLIAFFPAMIAYLTCWPRRRLVNPFFAVLAGVVALMLVVLILAIVDVRIAWLSWVFLAAAILLVPKSVTMYRRGRAISREYERGLAERRAKGY
jgi:ABC-type transport system involved in cytochrome bd biosynthesis fused ATPase/permease subunit